MFIYFYLILAFGLFIVNAGNKTYHCVDCRIPLKNCHIWETGYDILKPHQQARAIDHSAVDGAISNSLDTCIPEGLNIKEQDIGVACVWSPKTGCQMLLGKSDLNPSCLGCLYDANMKRFCPCQNIPIEERAASGSERIYPMRLYMVQILISLFKYMN